jgi:hypothetical protein
MKEQIKKLRIQIDGLSQLVKELKPVRQFSIDISKLPNESSLEEVIDVFEKTGYAVGHGKEFITPLPQQFKEIEKAYDSLILAKAWLGKMLGELGAESPYPKDGTRKTVKDIEPTADVNNEVPFGDRVGETLFRDKNRIEKVDWLRQEIQKIVNITDPYREYENNLIWENMSTVGMAYLFNANRHLSEARFWLGFELQRIRESS